VAVSSGERICPRCGTRSQGVPWCPKCGLNMRTRVPAAPAGVTPPTAEQPPPAPRRAPHDRAARRPPYLLIGGIVALAAIGIVVGLVVSSGGDRGASTTPSPTTQTSAPASTAATTAAPTVATSTVQEVLRQYEGDYSSENAEGLKALFASSLVRQNGSEPSENLEQAVATYQRQFGEQTNPSYKLSNVSIQPGAGEATASARYTITNQNGTLTGSIVFHLIEENGQLLIDKLTIEPSK
jgi:hypothetical protein